MRPLQPTTLGKPIFQELMNDLIHIRTYGDPGSQETAYDAIDRAAQLWALFVKELDDKTS